MDHESPQNGSVAAGAGPPAQIGRFEVLRELGRGAMGIVYAGHDPELDRKVAIKVLQKTGARATTRMRREAQAMAKIAHPNVAHVYEVGTWNDRLYLAIEFIDGVTLGEWCRDSTRGVEETLATLTGAGMGLHAAHEAGLVHRDFKFDNVMVGHDGRPRVLDFGLVGLERDDSADTEVTLETLATRFEDAAPDNALDTPLTATGTVLGTPAYMSPEQFNNQTIGPKSDQFSFAVTAYEALYGERPFAGRSFLELGVSVTKGQIKDPPEGSRVDAQIRTALLRALSVDPGERYDSMAELLEAIQPRKRSRARWFAVSAMAGVLALGGWLLTGAGPDPSTEAQAEPDERAEIIAASQLPAEITEPLDGDPLQMQIHRLDNGLTVYISPNPEEAAVSYAWGSRIPPHLGNDGQRTLLSKVLSGGTEDFGTTDWEAEKPHRDRLRELYAQVTPSNVDDWAQLYADVDAESKQAERYVIPDEYNAVLKAVGMRGISWDVMDPHGIGRMAELTSSGIGPAIELEAAMIRRPTFRGLWPATGEMVDWWDSMIERPHANNVVHNVMQRELLGESPFAATPESMRAKVAELPYDEVRSLAETWIVPNNTAIAIAGDIDPAVALAIVEDAFGDWTTQRLPSDVSPPEPPAPPRDIVKVEASAVRGDVGVALGWLVPTDDPPEGTRDVAESALLSTALGGPRFRFVDMQDHGGASIFTLSARLDEGAEPAAVAAKIRETVDALARGKIDEEWLARATDAAVERARFSQPNRQRIQVAIHSFLRGEEWSQTVESRLDPTPEVDAAAIAAWIDEHLGDGHVQLAIRPGEPEPKPPIGPPVQVSSVESRSSGPSALAKSLLAKKPVLEPQFLNRGVDFEEYATAAGRFIHVTGEDNGRFYLDVRFDEPTRPDAVTCLMLESVGGVNTPQGEPTRTALERLEVRFSPRCDVRDTGADFHGSENGFVEGWELVRNALETLAETPPKDAIDDARARSAERARTIESVRKEYPVTTLLGETLGTGQLRATDYEAVTAAQVRERAALFAAAQADYRYTGRLEAKRVRELLHLDESREPLPRFGPPRAPKALTEDTIVAHRGPEKPKWVSVVWVYESDSSTTAVAAEILHRCLRTRELFAESTIDPGLLPRGNLRALMVTVKPNPETSVDELLAVLEAVRTPATPECFELGKSAVEQELREKRSNRDSIARRVGSWPPDATGDPRLDQWRALSDMDLAAVEAFRTKLVANYGRFFVGGLDDAKLRDFEVRLRDATSR